MFRFTIRNVLSIVALMHLAVSVDPILADDPKADVWIVPGPRGGDGKSFVEFTAKLPISPEEARARIVAWNKERPDGEDAVIGQLEGIVNDEYVFQTLDLLHKKGFVLYGYHVNVKSGRVRYVTLKALQTEYGGRFPKGYIPTADLPRFVRTKAE